MEILIWQLGELIMTHWSFNYLLNFTYIQMQMIKNKYNYKSSHRRSNDAKSNWFNVKAGPRQPMEAEGNY